MMRVVPPRFPPGDPRADSWILLITVAVSTVIWVTVTYVTAPESPAVLDRFYRRVRPGGAGWARVSEAAGFGREPVAGGALAFTNWVAGVIAVYTTLFGLGKLVFGEIGLGLALLAIATGAFAWIGRALAAEERLSRGDGTAGTERGEAVVRP